jgi:hypothetical protein
MLVWLGSAAAAGGVAILRRAWALPARAPAMNGTGWAALLAGQLLGAAGDGAWGMAITVQAAIGAACLFLAHAALTSPRPKRQPAEREVSPPSTGLRLGPRFLSFLLTVPAALAVALLVSVGARSVASATGWHEADANVLTLFLLPLMWAALATGLLMSAKRRTQVLVLLMPALAGGVALAVGGAA